MRLVPRLLPLVLAASCAGETAAPLGQVLLVVTTDAPLPPAPGERPSADAPLPLFDRISVDVFAPGESTPCAECSRDFAVDARMADEGRMSFGAVTRPGVTGYRARVRLYRSASGARGTGRSVARPSSTIEAVVDLPIVAAEGVVQKMLVLRTEDVARPRGTLDAPAPLEPSAAPLRSGSWPPAKVVPCTGAPEDDEVCVPGGTYWMGGAGLLDLEDFDLGGGTERLVMLSPFFVDRDEVTVGALRASGVATADTPERRGSSPEWRDCTYTSEPGAYEEHPVNCLRWSLAKTHCEARGRRLPTEAEFELLAGGRRGTRYVWGEDEPRCEDAVYARIDQSALANGRDCRDFGLGSAPIRSGARDVLAIGDRQVFDLAGSVSEWMADAWSPDGGPCWSEGVLHDPLCTPEISGDRGARSYRGGSYPSSAGLLRAAVRQRVPDVDRYVLPSVGFRCARPAR